MVWLCILRNGKPEHFSAAAQFPFDRHPIVARMEGRNRACAVKARNPGLVRCRNVTRIRHLRVSGRTDSSMRATRLIFFKLQSFEALEQDGWQWLGPPCL